MLIYIILTVILWLVLPIFINGRIKKKHDRKALIMLCRILAIAFIALAIYRELFI